jgi:hypothetical protein
MLRFKLGLPRFDQGLGRVVSRLQVLMLALRVVRVTLPIRFSLEIKTSLATLAKRLFGSQDSNDNHVLESTNHFLI